MQNISDEVIQKLCTNIVRNSDAEPEPNKEVQESAEPIEVAPDSEESKFDQLPPANRRELFANHLGIGVYGNSVGGWGAYYSHNLDENWQINLIASSGDRDSDSSSEEEEPVLALIELEATFLNLGIRRFFSPNYGFFYGAGLGILNNSLTFTSLSTTSFSYEASGSGYYAHLELGYTYQGDEWQFMVSVQPGTIFSYADNFNAEDIPDEENWRAASQTYWDLSRSSSFSSAGFAFSF